LYVDGCGNVYGLMGEGVYTEHYERKICGNVKL
jgi:hypothetical protein